MPLSMSSLPQFRPVQATTKMTRPSSGLSTVFELMGARLTVSRNAEIYGEGETAEYLYKVVGGVVRTSRVTADGRRQIGGFYLPGDIFGIETDDEHAYSAEAITDATVLFVQRGAVFSLAERDGDVARQLWTSTAGELTRAQGRLLLLVKSAHERVAGFLLEMTERSQGSDQVELPMTRQDIGDYLGLTIETVSRTLTSLADEAMIELATSRRIVLRDRRALQALSE